MHAQCTGQRCMSTASDSVPHQAESLLLQLKVEMFVIPRALLLRKLLLPPDICQIIGKLLVDHFELINQALTGMAVQLKTLIGLLQPCNLICTLLMLI